MLLINFELKSLKTDCILSIIDNVLPLVSLFSSLLGFISLFTMLIYNYAAAAFYTY